MIDNFWIYAVLLISTVVNIVVPISGSATVVPLLAILTDPHLAIGLASFYFVLSGVVRIYLFRKDIQWDEIKKLLLPSVGMAFIGASALVAVPDEFLVLVIFAFTSYFLIKKIFPTDKKATGLTNHLVGLLSGFLQGTGLSGSDLRNSYLYSQKLNIAQVHGTSSLIGTSNFFVATVARLLTGQVTIPNLVPLIYLLPFIVVAVLVGRHVLYMLPRRVTDAIIVVVMLVIVASLGAKILQILL